MGAAGGEHTITVDSGKTIAFVVPIDDDTKTLDGEEGSPTLTVTGAGTTVFLHQLQLTSNTDNVGISVEAGAALFADSVQITQNFSGGIVLASETSAQLRNCMVGSGGDVDVPAILVNGGNLDATYTTILGGLGSARALECTSGSATVRNSIITTGGGSDALVCPGADIPGSVVENTANPDWFENYNQGDASLTDAGETQFADFATWEDGDPPFDFEGDARPASDGSPDHAGADTIP